MKEIARINVGRFTHKGISKRGIIHLGYWDDEKDKLCWVAQSLFTKTKNKQKRTEYLSA